jgi:uncharacterized protein
MGELDLDDALTLLRAFAVDYGGGPGQPRRFLALGVTAEVLERAVMLAGAHGLRAYDAVQLAGALAARAVDPRCAALASFDRELLRAALAEGFADATAGTGRRAAR